IGRIAGAKRATQRSKSSKVDFSKRIVGQPLGIRPDLVRITLLIAVAGMVCERAIAFQTRRLRSDLPRRSLPYETCGRTRFGVTTRSLRRNQRSQRCARA